MTRVMGVNQKPVESIYYSGLQYREIIREGNRNYVLTDLVDTACVDLIILAERKGNFFQGKFRISSILNLLSNLTCPLFFISEK